MTESGDLIASGDPPKKISVSRHEKNLRQLRCMVSMMYPVTLHHCHGGSMLGLGPAFQNPGMGERNNPFFQIPIILKYHVGPMGIDGSSGVVEWERTFGSQVGFLHEVNEQLEYDIWEQAKLWSNENWKSATPVQSHLG